MIPEAALDLDATDPGMRRRQLAAVLRLEFRRILLGKRAIVVYLLALLPVLNLTLRAIAISRGWLHTTGSPEMMFAQMYQSFLLRFVIFFGCAWIFTNLFRGEILDRSLHYYFLCPIPRERLVAGKYIAGLAASLVIFVGCTVASYVLLWLPHGAEGIDHLLVNPGLGRLIQYATISALACAGYGAVFLLAGVFVRNPMVPAVILLLWEGVNFLLPPVLKMFSVIHYLVSLCPVAISEGPFAFVADPTPWWASVPGLFVVTALILWAAAHRVRRSEILYGTD